MSEKQTQIILDDLAKFNIISGVTGSGKSWGANARWYAEILEAPENALLMQTGNTSESLYDNITAPLLELDAKEDNVLEYITIENRRRIRCKLNNASVVCIGASDEKAQDRIQGKNLWFWYGDEITKQPRSFVEMALSRLRATVDGKLVTRPCMWTCNPDSPTHYIKTEYIDNPEIDVKNWFFGFKDNPTITDEYIEQLKKRFSGVFYERMIEGRWTLAEGAIYNEFNPATHIIQKPFNQIDTYFLGVDWGYNNPMAMTLIGRDFDGVYYVLDELYLQKQLVDESLKEMLIRKGWHELGDYKRPPQLVYADSESPGDCDALRRLMGWAVVPVSKPAGSVLDGIKIVQQLLKTGGNDKSRLYFLQGCKNVIREMQSYQWRKRLNKDEKDEPEKKNDHAMDALRYVLMNEERGKVKVIGGFKR